MTPRRPAAVGIPAAVRNRLTRALIAWIRLVRRNALAVILIALVSAVAAGWYTVTNVAINTSTTDMLDEDLPFQQQFAALDEVFPQDYRTILIVVDAETPERAKAAAAALTQRLSQYPAEIRSVFHPEGDPFFRRNGLLFLDVAELEALSGMLAGAQPLLAGLADDPSLRGLSTVMTLALDNLEQAGGVAGERLPPQFEHALNGIAATVERVTAGEPATFSWRGALAHGGDPELTGTRQILLLEPVFDFASLQPAEKAIERIRRTVADLGLQGQTDVSVRLTGEPVMVAEELQTVEESIGLANLLSLAVVVVLLVVGLRSARLVEATTLSLLVGLTWTAFFAVAVVGELNLISVAFAVLFIGFGVDFGIHVCLRTKEYIDSDIGPGLALEEAAVGVAPGLAMTTVAAAIGFLAFVPTVYQGLVELGVISTAGMFVALFTSLTLVPAWLSLRTPAKSAIARQQEMGHGLEELLQRRARPVLWGALGLTVACAATVPFARFEDSPLTLRDPETESLTTLADLMQDRRFDPFRATVLADDAAAADAIAAKLRALPEVDRVETATDLVPARQDEKLAMLDDLALILGPVLAPAGGLPPPTPAEQRAALERLQASAARVAETDGSPGAARLVAALRRFPATDGNLAALQQSMTATLPPMLAEISDSMAARPVALSDIPPQLLARRQTTDGRVLVEAFARADLRDAEERRRFATAVQRVVPEATGEAIVVTEAGRAVVRSFFQAGGFAFVLISAMLLLILRSVRDSLIVMAPLILAGLLTVATTVVLALPFNFANVIVLPLLFGLGVSSGINMMMRGRQQGARSLLITSTPRAVLFSALTTIGSFGSLAVSQHPGMASMGQLLTAALVYTTLCTLVVLPALRLVFAPHARPD